MHTQSLVWSAVRVHGMRRPLNSVKKPGDAPLPEGDWGGEAHAAAAARSSASYAARFCASASTSRA